MTTNANNRSQSFFFLAILIGVVACLAALISYVNYSYSGTDMPTGIPSVEPTLTPLAGTPLTVTFVPPASSSAPVKPTPQKVTVEQNTYCYNGPDDRYQILHRLIANSEVNVLGINSDDGTWALINNNVQGNPLCWINLHVLSYSIKFDIILTVVAIQESACRFGPSDIWSIQTKLGQGRRVQVQGMSDLEGTWLFVIPPNLSDPCWVASHSLSAFNRFNVPLEPTTTPHPTVTEGSGGGGGEVCQSEPVCEYQVTKIDVCAKWTGNGDKCVKWEKQNVENKVCRTVCN